MSSSTRRRVASNTAVQVAGKGVVLAIGVVSIAVLTRYLGPRDYGRYTLALVYMQVFGVLADVGLFTTVVREISKDRERTQELVGNALALRLCLSIVVVAVAGAVSLLLPYERDLRLAILLAGGPLVLGMVTTTFVTVLQSRLIMSRAVIGDVVGRAVSLGLVLAVAALDLGFFAVLGAAAGGALATLVITSALTRGLVALRPRADFAVWRTLLAAAVPLGLALAINALYFRVDTLIISLFEPYAQVGLYTLAYRILELLLVVGSIFLNTTFPLLSEAIGRGEEERVRRTVQVSTDLLVLLGVPLVAGGLLLAPQVVELVAGSDFAGTAEPLRILLAAGALAWINGVFGFALIAKERQLSALWLNVSALIFNVGLNLLLVPRYGIIAAAVVTVASELLILAGSFHLMRRHFGFFPALRTLPAALAGAAVMSTVVVVLGDFHVLALVTLGAVVYAALVWVVSPLSRELASGLRA